MPTGHFHLLPWKPKCKKKKKKIEKKSTLKIISSETVHSMGLRLVEIFVMLIFADFVFLMKIGSLVWLPWQLRFSIVL